MDKETNKEPERDTKADDLVRLAVMLGNYEILPPVEPVPIIIPD